MYPKNIKTSERGILELQWCFGLEWSECVSVNASCSSLRSVGLWRLVLLCVGACALVGDVETRCLLRSRGHGHGALAVTVNFVRVSAVTHQLAGNLIEALNDGKVERCNAVVGVGVDVGAVAQEERNKLRIALLACNVERCDALARVAVNVHLLLQQQLDGGYAALLHSDVKRGQPVVGYRVGVTLQTQQQLHRA
mmetsp:Transcript_27361/g.43972  ORF Transcript_27361/g.43972 Transcript_27361/m.43972 type:complete len:195 (-) Transcript_27361:637-1221(-)